MQETYLNQMATEKLVVIADRATRIRKFVPDMPNKISANVNKFISDITQTAMAKATLEDVVASDEIYVREAPGLNADGRALASKLVGRYNEYIISVLPEAFTKKGRQHILPQVLVYAERHRSLLSDPRCQYIAAKYRIMKCYEQNDIRGMASAVFALNIPEGDILREDFADTIKQDIENSLKKPDGSVAIRTVAALSLLTGYIREGIFDAVYAEEQIGRYIDKLPANPDEIKQNSLFENNTVYTIGLIIAAVSDIVKGAGDPQLCIAALQRVDDPAGGTGIAPLAKTLLGIDGKKTYKAFMGYLTATYASNKVYAPINAIFESLNPSFSNKIKSLLSKKGAK